MILELCRASLDTMIIMLINKYLKNYPAELIAQVENLLQQKKLAEFLLKRYPQKHTFANDALLRGYVVALKNEYMQKAAPLSKVIYDNKLHIDYHALGLHSYISRVQGSKLKSKNEIRISAVFKNAPEAFLNMIVVHELAHLKEKDHNKAFYRLCLAMLPEYHQLEFDMRLFLIETTQHGSIY